MNNNQHLILSGGDFVTKRKTSKKFFPRDKKGRFISQKKLFFRDKKGRFISQKRPVYFFKKFFFRDKKGRFISPKKFFLRDKKDRFIFPKKYYKKSEKRSSKRKRTTVATRKSPEARTANWLEKMNDELDPEVINIGKSESPGGPSAKQRMTQDFRLAKHKTKKGFIYRDLGEARHRLKRFDVAYVVDTPDGEQLIKHFVFRNSPIAARAIKDPQAYFGKPLSQHVLPALNIHDGTNFKLNRILYFKGIEPEKRKKGE